MNYALTSTSRSDAGLNLHLYAEPLLPHFPSPVAEQHSAGSEESASSPAHPVSAGFSPANANHPPVAGKPSENNRAPLVMLLEDEMVLSQLLECCIHKKFEKADILTLRSGDEAWRVLATLTPDLLVMDWKHHGMSGGDILNGLIGRGARFPILLTSSLFVEQLRTLGEHGLKLKYLPKPFTPHQFFDAMTELVGRTA